MVLDVIRLLFNVVLSHAPAEEMQLYAAELECRNLMAPAPYASEQANPIFFYNIV